MKTKVCVICNEEQSIEEFRLQPQTKDGRANQCRLCRNKHQREKRKREIEYTPISPPIPK